MTTPHIARAILRDDEPTVLPSYLKDQWVWPQEGGRISDISDPATGARIARATTTGLDSQGAVEHGRRCGHENLAKLSFHDRALILKDLALYLQEHKEQLYQISYHTGATSRDHLIDVDGGIGTLFVFSSKGRREMPNSTVMIDGSAEQLSRDGTFLGEHIYTPIPGVAVQINAFNFPVWGFLEKFAPAFIAGVPTILKPATPTSYVAAACVELMINSGLLPDGSLQLISGSAGDLLSHLDYRDHVAFTGSAGTAAMLRKQVADGVRFSAEADSLNAAILGEGVSVEDPEFDAYIRTLFGEISAKAGQKCTAIRRALVPESMVEAVVSALSQRINDKIIVGNPQDDATTMGPVVSLEQAEDVKAATQRLIEAGGVLKLGGPNAIDGAFVPPTILSFDGDNRWAEAVHTVEAFGPVVSVVAYHDRHEAIELAARGGGSLVATVCTHDAEEAAAYAQGIAAHHGRLHFLDRDDARSTTGHGSPLPHLIHGGPGRAGGGEELGGVRGIKHYMQRSAIQGTPDHLTAITGQWHRGARVNKVTRAEVDAGTGTHPFRKSLAELRIGDQFASDLRTVELKDILDFAHTTGDTFYAHTDEEAAMANPFFPRRVAHGYLLVSWAAGLFVEPQPGPVLANYGLENLRFITPVTYGDAIRVELTAKRITPRVTDDYGEVAWDTVLYNQNDEIVAQYDVLTLVEKEHLTYG
ncbi:phenylacetic acid degradation bifunctional protein PaaZ [Corynebacterium sp. 3HC-13]|uniref:phenylacetic acid degradation bifunctional protein PaaZ n=1 Tax=Corynebacterium poyangense TaxID=2684405 RepID=UPI001CCB93B7|nr:phenylacetic acid degradation bifunctional protein PaaZ [Corynebacterium poyangense]MBZ8177240.1 phenylacetic acid degradation bifunctional protein PaaZ [Corynebacterium poyangense]